MPEHPRELPLVKTFRSKLRSVFTSGNVWLSGTGRVLRATVYYNGMDYRTEVDVTHRSIMVIWSDMDMAVKTLRRNIIFAMDRED